MMKPYSQHVTIIYSGWWFQIFFIYHPYLKKISNLTSIFSKGLKPPTRKLHNLAKVCCSTFWAWICQLLSDFLPSFATLFQASDWIKKNTLNRKPERKQGILQWKPFFKILRESINKCMIVCQGFPLLFWLVPCLVDSVISTNPYPPEV